MENLFENNDSSIESCEKLYLQIHKIKLQDYISRGLIMPDMYFDNEIEKDVQSKNKSYIVVSSSYIDSIDETQLLLELIFTDAEKKEFKKSGDIYFYEKPIAITRIKQIYIQDKKTKDKLLTKIMNYKIGYIPESLFVFFKKGRKIIFDKCNKYQALENADSIDYQEKIIKFDKMMGMFAFMKNSDLYYFDKTKTYSNYARSYISILSKLNDSLETTNSKLFDMITDNKDFFDHIYTDKLVNDDFIKSFLENEKDEEIREIFSTLLYDNNSKRKCLERLRHKDGIFFYVCLLYIHRQKDSNKKDNFKSNIAQEIPYEKAELALAFLGLHYGYSSIRADEEILIDDKYINKFIEKNRVNMKFKLDCKLDYITIETIYNYTFYDKKGEEFDYLEYPSAKKSTSLSSDVKFTAWYKVEKKDILDTQYVRIRKHTFVELVTKSMSNYKEEIGFGKYYLASFVAMHYKYLLFYSKDGKPVEPYFEKSNFLEIIKEETNTIKQEKLLKVFELDNK